MRYFLLAARSEKWGRKFVSRWWSADQERPNATQGTAGPKQIFNVKSQLFLTEY